MTDRPTCETCRWWDRSDRSLPPPLGMCRIRSPQSPRSEFVHDGLRYSSGFPFVTPTDWCGEHQPNTLMPPAGCICPPGAEATCQGPLCPRRGVSKGAGND